MKKPQFLIAAPSSHSGKTTLTLGLLRLLHNRGLTVQPFKCGPDYIDTTHHTTAAHRQSINLDTFMMSEPHVRMLYRHYSQQADVTITEGVMGLFDGAIKWEGGSAAIAMLLDIPVILVVNAKGMAYSVAPLLYGLKNFNPDVKVAGVIFNNVNTESHYQFLKEACEDVGVTPLGYIPVNDAINIPSRHLGLSLSATMDYDLIADHISKTVDIDMLLAITTKDTPVSITVIPATGKKKKIAVARDEAFNFIYAENIRRLQQLGTVTFFSPLRDTELPDADLIYLAGGYPELHLAALQNNSGMRTAIRAYCEWGGQVMAECGGMMYLGKGITDQAGNRHEMCGFLDIETTMQNARLTLGYRQVELEDDILRGHEFHYSHATENSPVNTTAEVLNARGMKVNTPIYKQQNVIASYIHFYWAEDTALFLSLWNNS